MNPISFKRHRFPPAVIVQAVRWYFRFTLSIRDVEELVAERGIEVSREAIRCWVIKFGPLIAANLRRGRSRPTAQWHLDEVVVKIGGRRMYLWRAVDYGGDEGDKKRKLSHDDATVPHGDLVLALADLDVDGPSRSQPQIPHRARLRSVSLEDWPQPAAR